MGAKAGLAGRTLISSACRNLVFRYLSATHTPGILCNPAFIFGNYVAETHSTLRLILPPPV